MMGIIEAEETKTRPGARAVLCGYEKQVQFFSVVGLVFVR
jgi:hypothetical protein